MDEHTEGRILDLRDDVAQLQAEVDQLTAERDRLRAVTATAGDAVALVLAHYEVDDDARTQLLDVVDQTTAALEAVRQPNG